MKNIFLVINAKQLFVFLLLISSVGFFSCSNEKSTETQNSDSSDSTATEAEPDLVSITNDQFSSSGMKLGKMTEQEFHQAINTNGMFDVPPENMVSISSYFGGYVKNLTLLPGEKVKKGQLIIVLENPEYVQIQQDFLEAKGQLNYLKSEYERQKNLVKDNITSQKNYLKSEADFNTTLAKFESLKKKLSLMNISADRLTPQNIQSTISVISPINGYVTKVNVNRGMFLNPSDIMVTIINTDHIHLELTVFERDLGKIKVGQPIMFKLQSDSVQEYEASVHLVNRSIDPEKRTASIHGHLKDESNTEMFIPGMYVEAQIYISTETAAALPKEAVVNIDENYFVLVKTSANEWPMKFEKREVKVGKLTNDYIEILNSGEFDGNTEFLINGAFNLISV